MRTGQDPGARGRAGESLENAEKEQRLARQRVRDRSHHASGKLFLLLFFCYLHVLGFVSCMAWIKKKRTDGS